MSFARELKRKAKAAVAPLIFLSLVGYFGWHATQGDLGLKAYAQRQHDLQAAEANLARVQVDLAGWERRVRALRANHLDPDALDERARAMLNLTDPADLVVPYAANAHLF